MARWGPLGLALHDLDVLVVLEPHLVELRKVVGLCDARHRVGLQLHVRHVALDLRRLAAGHPADDAE
eukprot:4944778-Alexandrium_andersonii.AAC.1